MYCTILYEVFEFAINIVMYLINMLINLSESPFSISQKMTYNFTTEELATSLINLLDRKNIFPPLFNNPEYFLSRKDAEPKRTLNAFFICRKNVQNEASNKSWNSNMRIISKAASILWKTASPEEKAVYENLASQVDAINKSRTSLVSRGILNYLNCNILYQFDSSTYPDEIADKSYIANEVINRQLVFSPNLNYLNCNIFYQFDASTYPDEIADKSYIANEVINRQLVFSPNLTTAINYNTSNCNIYSNDEEILTQENNSLISLENLQEQYESEELLSYFYNNAQY
jgi:hypothetical protein